MSKKCGECKYFQKVCQNTTPETDAELCLNFKSKAVKKQETLKGEENESKV